MSSRKTSKGNQPAVPLPQSKPLTGGVLSTLARGSTASHEPGSEALDTRIAARRGQIKPEKSNPKVGVKLAAAGKQGRTAKTLHAIASQTELRESEGSSIRAGAKANGERAGAAAIVTTKRRVGSPRGNSGTELSTGVLSASGPEEAVATDGADMSNKKTADARTRALSSKDRTVGSPVTMIEVSSRSGGDKVKAIDTIKAAAKAGEAGAIMASLPAGYRPSDNEPFMNERQRLYFRNKLIAWKEEIVRQNRETLQGLHEDSAQHADVADRATFETDRALELRARDRQRKLIAKIDAAVARIEDGSYGYCEETGEPISLKRLDARPIATLSIEAQERHERRERVFREE